MRFKLDENLGTRTQSIFSAARHDIHTVVQEGLQSAHDEHVWEHCKEERRCLVTLDLDFANVLRFPPQQTSGVIVIRVPHNPSLAQLEAMIRTCLHAVEQMPVQGRLWIVETGRIRVHQPEPEDDTSV